MSQLASRANVSSATRVSFRLNLLAKLQLLTKLHAGFIPVCPLYLSKVISF